MQAPPELGDEQGPSVRQDGAGCTMESQDVVDIQSSQLLSAVAFLDGYEVGDLG